MHELLFTFAFRNRRQEVGIMVLKITANQPIVTRLKLGAFKHKLHR